MEKITIIDSRMGTGKTSMMIRFMDQHPHQAFIFVTPYLNEVERIKNTCILPFYDPLNYGSGKQESLKHLLSQGLNVVTTHSLFLATDSETEELIQTGGYTLILDEVLDVLTPYNREFPDCKIRRGDIDYLLEKGSIAVDEYGAVSWLDHGGYADFTYKQVEQLARAGNLICIDNALFLCQFPPRIFSLFKEVYVLTYQFDGSILQSYFRFHGLSCLYKSVRHNGANYEMCPYQDDAAERQSLKKLVTIIDDNKLNEVGEPYGALSKTRFKNADGELIKQLKKNINVVLKNRLGGVSSRRIMWSAFKDDREAIEGAGYTNIRKLTKEENKLPDQKKAKLQCFVACNSRATNDFADRDVLLYLINRFPNPEIIKYFARKNVKLDGDRFALNELLQWVWRSAIRNGKHIDVYIPSRRMRQLLIDWLDGR